MTGSHYRFSEDDIKDSLFDSHTVFHFHFHPPNVKYPKAIPSPPDLQRVLMTDIFSTNAIHGIGQILSSNKTSVLLLQHKHYDKIGNFMKELVIYKSMWEPLFLEDQARFEKYQEHLFFGEPFPEEEFSSLENSLDNTLSVEKYKEESELIELIEDTDPELVAGFLFEKLHEISPKTTEEAAEFFRESGLFNSTTLLYVNDILKTSSSQLSPFSVELSIRD